jgi:hypothetical protein
VDGVHGLAGASGRRPFTIDDEYAAIARDKVPGFGGLYFDSSGNMVVHLVDLSAQSLATDALAAIFNARRPNARNTRSEKGSIIFKQASFNFLQLKNWNDLLMSALIGNRGVYLADIDERENRIWLGIADTETAATVNAALQRLGIPAGAVIMEVVPQPRQFQTVVYKTLSDYVRPVLGGLKIESASHEPCTLGFNAAYSYFDPNVYFVTASHCSDRRGFHEGISFHQPDPTWYYGGGIGNESKDPPSIDPATDPRCLRPNCRYSDALLATYGSQVYAFGGIARPDHSLGSTQLTMPDGIAPTIQIEAKEPYGRVGHAVDKVGYNTGWTFGGVTRTCLTTNTVDAQTGEDWSYVCQSEVQANANYGDSGSAVFYYRYESATQAHFATLVGLLTSGVDVNGTRYYYFSPMNQIEYELGSLIVH